MNLTTVCMRFIRFYKRCRFESNSIMGECTSGFDERAIISFPILALFSYFLLLSAWPLLCFLQLFFLGLLCSLSLSSLPPFPRPSLASVSAFIDVSHVYLVTTTVLLADPLIYDNRPIN